MQVNKWNVHKKILISLLAGCQFGAIAAYGDSSPRIGRLEPAQKPYRSSYESLTEDRSTFALLAQARKEEEEKLAQEIAQKEEQRQLLAQAASPTAQPAEASPSEGTIINFNNVSITEVVRYVSRITGRNFVYDPQELQFNVTIQSEAPTTIEDVMIMLLQNLRIHGFMLMEDGPNFMIHLNPQVRASGSLFKGKDNASSPQIVSQVYVLQNVAAEKCAAIVKTMLSDNASIEVIEDSKIIVTDLVSNIIKLNEIITKLDVETSGLEVGQYVALNSSPAGLIAIAEQLLAPIAATKPLVLVPHGASNSVFIVSTPFLIDKTLSVLQTIDLGRGRSGILSDVKFDAKAEEAAKKRVQIEEQALQGLPEFSKDQLENMTDEEIKRLLRERGFTEQQVNLLNPRDSRTLLWEDMNSPQALAQQAAERRKALFSSELPLGQAESTQFLIYTLQYRKSTEIAQALRAIAISLGGGYNEPPPGSHNTPPPQQPMRDIAQSDLLMTLHSLQAVDENNTIVFTGTKTSLAKVKELITQIDKPARQVFIETLVLDTTLQNSLQFGVEWSGRIERTNFGAQVGFVDNVTSNFAPVFNAVGQFVPPQIVPPTAGGFEAGCIGRKIKFMGQGFRSTGALIHALSLDTETQIMMNPKISTEHNVPAEVFVGQQIPIKGQSIVNATGVGVSNVVATNYTTAQTGISLKVTPLISSQDTVTLIIDQRISSADTVQVAAQGNQNAPPATTNETRTLTRVHMPSDHFFIMSGLISEEKDMDLQRIPCLGAIPIIGTFFSIKVGTNNKRNILIFIRPIIIDSPFDIDEITKKQEQILKAKSKTERGWRKELKDVEEIANL